jgi:ABC-type Mn2+/Zn2+ transport system ATPase subunit/SAM-dependent methyltransferase
VQEEILTSISGNGDVVTSEAVSRFLLAMFHLSHVGSSDLSTLSGGEAQRLALLLAIISPAKSIIIDHALAEQDRNHLHLLKVFLKRFSKLLDLQILHRKAAKDLRASFRELPTSTTGLVDIRDLKISSRTDGLCSVDAVGIASNSITLITGDNGAGKSLLCRAIIGELPRGLRQSGTISWTGGQQEKCSYVNQDVTLGFSHVSVRGELASVGSGLEARFLRFPGVDREDLELSPFELTLDKQHFLATLKALAAGAKLAVLDEPSEHWDNEQLACAVEEFRDYVGSGGSLVIATHDARLSAGADDMIRLLPTKRQRKAARIMGSPQIRPAMPSPGKELMYSAWRDLHEQWPASTLELFENWDAHVDGMLREQAASILGLGRRFHLLDLGCGNGLQTLWLRSMLIDSGLPIDATLGVDWQDNAIAWANFWAGRLPNVSFETFDIDMFLQGPQGATVYNLITSLFVLHDVPDLAAHLRQVHAYLPDGGSYLCCLLNPSWVNDRAGSVIGDGLEIPTDALFAAEYRLPESESGAVRLPYFHRTCEMYQAAFATAGFEVIRVFYGPPDHRIPPGRTVSPHSQTIGFVATKSA